MTQSNRPSHRQALRALERQLQLLTEALEETLDHRDFLLTVVEEAESQRDAALDLAQRACQRAQHFLSRLRGERAEREAFAKATLARIDNLVIANTQVWARNAELAEQVAVLTAKGNRT